MWGSQDSPLETTWNLKFSTEALQGKCGRWVTDTGTITLQKSENYYNIIYYIMQISLKQSTALSMMKIKEELLIKKSVLGLLNAGSREK